MLITLKNIGLEGKVGDELYENYLVALNEYVASLGDEVRDIVLCGSFAKGKLQVGSDIDLVIIDDEVEEITLNEVVVSGVKVATINCSKAVLLEVIKGEESKFVRRIAHLLTGGVSLRESEDCAEIIMEAGRVLESDLPQLTEKEIEAITEFISKHKELAVDYLARYDELAFFTRFGFAVQEMVQIYFKLNKKIIPNWKWTAAAIEDEDFLNDLLEFYKGRTKEEKCNAVIALLERLEKIMVVGVSD